MKITSKLMIAALVLLAACQKEDINKQSAVKSNSNVSEAMIKENGNNPDEAMLTANSSSSLITNGSSSSSNHVYIESNDSNGNAVVMYKQKWDGKLVWGSSTYSGGKGTSTGLGSQGSLVTNKEHTWLFAVNAGSNSVSSFKMKEDGGLELKYTANSGGTFPVSVCVYNDLLYVVNSATANICGFKIDQDGSMTKIKGSDKSLSAINALPAQIAFSPQGKSVLVTEKTANKISSFTLAANGAVKDIAYTNSAGEEPFGFDFSRDSYMIVSNAFQGAAGASTVTSYKNLSLNLQDVNGSVPNYQAASCWLVTAKYGRFAYVANTMSNTIVSYYINALGAVYFIPWSVTPTGLNPIDLAVSGNNLYVYNINSKEHTISEFKRGLLGTLNSIGKVISIPDFASGIAAD